MIPKKRGMTKTVFVSIVVGLILLVLVVLFIIRPFSGVSETALSKIQEAFLG